MSDAKPNLSSWKAHPSRSNNKVISNITVLLIHLARRLKEKNLAVCMLLFPHQTRLMWKCWKSQTGDTNKPYLQSLLYCLPRAGTLAAPVMFHHHPLVSVTSLYVSIQAVQLLPVLTHHSPNNISNWYHANHVLIINHRNVPDAFICQPLEVPSFIPSFIWESDV